MTKNRMPHHGNPREPVEEDEVTPDQVQDFGRRYAEAWCAHVPESVASFYDGESAS